VLEILVMIMMKAAMEMMMTTMMVTKFQLPEGSRVVKKW
jgi:hypothetical protein